MRVIERFLKLVSAIVTYHIFFIKKDAVWTCFTQPVLQWFYFDSPYSIHFICCLLGNKVSGLILKLFYTLFGESNLGKVICEICGHFVCTFIIFLNLCHNTGNVAMHERQIISLLLAHSFHHVTLFIYWICHRRFFSVTDYQVDKKQKLNYTLHKTAGVLLLFPKY